MASMWLNGCLNDLDVLWVDLQMASVWLNELDAWWVDSQMVSGLLIVCYDVLQVGSQMVSLYLIEGECGLEVWLVDSVQELGWRQLVFQCETLEVEERMIC